MYQNIWCEKRASNQVEVHLWDDKAGYQNFIFKNYAYVKDGAGQYQSIYGDKLKKVGYWTEEDFICNHSNNRKCYKFWGLINC